MTAEQLLKELEKIIKENPSHGNLKVEFDDGIRSRDIKSIFVAWTDEDDESEDLVVCLS